MTKTEALLTSAIMALLESAPTGMSCNDFHHRPIDRHSDSDRCDPMDRYETAINRANKLLRDLGHEKTNKHPRP